MTGEARQAKHAKRSRRRLEAARERLGWREAERQLREHRDPQLRVTLPRVRWLEAEPCER